MSETKSFASLDPMLLARKGTAKPAMRAQLGTNDRVAELGDELEQLAASQADLGWNDMGDADNVLTFDDARRLQGKLATNYVEDAAPTGSESTGTAPAKDRTKAVAMGRRAAFTLRLDEDRHLKLRLASTIRNCSSQVLVTEALDRLLDDMTELETLADQITHNTTKA